MEYLIGDFAHISRLGIKTLRYYHEIDLLRPSRVDPLTGYRYYDERCLAQVQAIRRLKDLNFSLSEIKECLAGQNETTTLLQIMQQKLVEVEGSIAGLERVRRRLASFIASESVPLIQPAPVTEKQVPDQLIAAIRFNGRYGDLDHRIPPLLALCGPAAAGPLFSLYYDDHPMEEGADIEICLPVSAPIESDPVHSRMLPGGRALSIIHPGAYEQIWISYQAVVDEWRRRRLEPLFPSREIYLRQGAVSAQHLTEIQFLV